MASSTTSATVAPPAEPAKPAGVEKRKAYSTSASKMGPAQAPAEMPDFLDLNAAQPHAHTTSAAVKKARASSDADVAFGPTVIAQLQGDNMLGMFGKLSAQGDESNS